MSIALTDKEHKQINNLKKNNRLLFLFGSGAVIFVVLVWIWITFNGGLFRNWLVAPDPRMAPAVQRLESIVPQTQNEIYLKNALVALVPIPITIIKGMAFNFILFFIFSIGVLSVGFSLQNKKALKLITTLINQK